MSTEAEWQQLRMLLREQRYNVDGLTNQFFRRLIMVLCDVRASDADRLLAYRDALLASGEPGSGSLPSWFDRQCSARLAEQFDLRIEKSGAVMLAESAQSADQYLSVYQLERRRYIHRVATDRALRSRLKDDGFTQYNGVAQQLAVRLAITADPDATLIVNLPTGCGKTLVAHALSLFASERQLTLVIVPTIGLAIEQGARVAALLKKSGLDHGGKYCWHSGQTASEHDDIKTRIREFGQRILFTSPDAACRSLLPTLFTVARAGGLGNLVVDEAHIIDQWGVEFRPYFQILASLVRSLRRVSRTGIKCLLMSATFTEKSLNVIGELFRGEGGACIHVNGCFLRPEIQYSVQRVTRERHGEAVIAAVIRLPKPLIVYTVTRQDAIATMSAIQSLGVTRVGLFTGDTDTAERERLLGCWAAGDLDFMVATSAFGLGMDKSDIRSVVHAAIPENLDRFYQEVGRGGRDGLSCQSLLIYFEDQVATAARLSNKRLITVKLGLKKWRAMWTHGSANADGGRNVFVSAIRSDQARRTGGNEEWNWRTLLLMQRAGMIRIELNSPAPPPFDAASSPETYSKQLDDYYDKYYRYVPVMPLRDDHLSIQAWDRDTRELRDYEKLQDATGLNELLRWVRNPEDTSLCALLTRHYTVDAVQPEYACGGCPHCRAIPRERSFPTVGRSVTSNAPLASRWRSPIGNRALHAHVYCRIPAGVRRKKLLNNWQGWLVRLIESRAIQAICASADDLDALQTTIGAASKAFWIGDELDGIPEHGEFWPQLVLHLDTKSSIPDLGWPESTKLLIAPEELADKNNAQRRWWQSFPGSVSMDNFLLGLNYGDH